MQNELSSSPSLNSAYTNFDSILKIRSTLKIEDFFFLGVISNIFFLISQLFFRISQEHVFRMKNAVFYYYYY